MADRPKPPAGYGSWLDACLSHPSGEWFVFDRREWEHARAELEELRNELATAREKAATIPAWRRRGPPSRYAPFGGGRSR